jgi:hypothetical protein
MSISINSHSLDLAVAGALVRIKEPRKLGMSDTVYAERLCSVIEVLTDILGPGTAYRRDRSSTKKPTFQCPDSPLLQWG